MTTGKKVLSAASPIYGHTVPALRLALELQSLGNELRVISYGAQMAELFNAYGVATVRNATKPPFDAFDKCVRETLSILETYQPDVTISDLSFDLWWALRRWRPTLRISILRGEEMPGYKPRNPFLVKNSQANTEGRLKLLNEFCRHQGWPLLKYLEELFDADLIVIPSIPQIDPLNERTLEAYPHSRFVYTGPLLLPIGRSVSDFLKEWIDERHEEGMPILLITLGTVWGAGLYTIMAECLESMDFALIMVVPDSEERGHLEHRNGHRLQAIPLTDLHELSGLSDVVLHHCGHATLHTVLLAGKPSITVPSDESEREDNALRLEELACGRHLGHDFFRKGINADALNAAVRDVLLDRRIQIGVKAVSKTIQHYIDKRATELRCLCHDGGTT
jgi:UDP:flavonoid glycosyltransferase YjiC (YdhE family)